jgi:hypothetical protein
VVHGGRASQREKGDGKREDGDKRKKREKKRRRFYKV